MNYYPFHIGDYLSHTAHLEPMEDLAYRRMLDWVYLHESHLPDSVEQIAKLIRMRTHCECIANVLQEFFERDDYGYFHRRAMSEIDKYKSKSEKNKAAARKRWDANALPTQCERNANQEPRTNNQEPRTKCIQSSSGDDGIGDALFDRFWSAYPRKVGKPNARKAFFKHVKTVDQLNLILDNIQRRIDCGEWCETDKQFIPHPATWLNREGWTDEMTPRAMSKNEQLAKKNFETAKSFLERNEKGDQQWIESF